MLEKPRCAGQAAVKRAAGVMRVKVLGRSRSSPNAREPMAAGVWVCLAIDRGLVRLSGYRGGGNWALMRALGLLGVVGPVHVDIS